MNTADNPGAFRRRTASLALAAVLALGLSTPGAMAEESIVVASTTSTEDSGLFGAILPQFTGRTGIDVKVVAQGTGQALDTARRGDADVVLVHARGQELAFIADGDGVDRYEVMYNDFVLIGPAADPAGVAGGDDITVALSAIAVDKAPFVSRGDRSGTHSAELRLWDEAGIDIDAVKEAREDWYRDIGQGMGAALNTARSMEAYVLSDRGTWLSFQNKGDLEVVVEGDQRLFNQYGVMLVNPDKHPDVKAGPGQTFIDWLISDEGQQAIADYKVDGKQLFFPNATGTPDNG